MSKQRKETPPSFEDTLPIDHDIPSFDDTLPIEDVKKKPTSNSPSQSPSGGHISSGNGSKEIAGSKKQDYIDPYAATVPDKFTRAVGDNTAIPKSPYYQEPDSTETLLQKSNPELHSKIQNVVKKERETKIAEENAHEKALAGLSPYEKTRNTVAAFTKPIYKLPSDALTAIAVGANFIDDKLGTEDSKKEVKDYATYQAADWLNKEVDKLMPEDSDFKQTYTSKIAGGLGQLVPMLFAGETYAAKALTDAPKLAPGLINASKAAVAEMATKQTAVAGTQVFSSEFRQAKEAGADDSTATFVAAANALVTSPLEALPIANAFKRLDKAFNGNFLKRVALNATTGGIEEAVTEDLQTGFSNLTAQQTYDTTREVTDGLIETSIVSGSVGGIFNALLSALGGRKTHAKTVEEKEKIEQAENYVKEKINSQQNTGTEAKQESEQQVAVPGQQANTDTSQGEDLASNIGNQNSANESSATIDSSTAQPVSMANSNGDSLGGSIQTGTRNSNSENSGIQEVDKKVYSEEEIAKAYEERDAELKNLKGLDYKEQFIHDNLGRITRKDFEHYADKNYLSDTKTIRGLYIKHFSKNALPLDVTAKQLTEKAGVEITPQDIVDYITDRDKAPEKYHKQEEEFRKVNEIKNNEDIALKLDESLLDLISSQGVSLENIDSIKDQYFSGFPYVETDFEQVKQYLNEQRNQSQENSQESSGFGIESKGAAGETIQQPRVDIGVIRNKARDARDSKDPEKARQLVQEIDGLLARENIIAGDGGSFATPDSKLFFDLIDQNKSIYLIPEGFKIAQSPEAFKEIINSLPDPQKNIAQSMNLSSAVPFDEAWNSGIIDAAKKLGFDGVRLTEIDGTDTTIHVLNPEKLEIVDGPELRTGSVNKPPSPPEPPTSKKEGDSAGKGKKKSLFNRLVVDNQLTPAMKEMLQAEGLEYDVMSTEMSDSEADKILNALGRNFEGLNTGFEMVQNMGLKFGRGSRFGLALKIKEVTRTLAQKAKSNADLDAYQKYTQLEYDIYKFLDETGREFGTEIQKLANLYNSSPEVIAKYEVEKLNALNQKKLTTQDGNGKTPIQHIKAQKKSNDRVNKEAAESLASSSNLDKAVEKIVGVKKKKAAEKRVEKIKKAIENIIPELDKLKIDTNNTAFDATLGIPITVWNGSIEAMKKVLQASGTAIEAIDAAIQHIKIHYNDFNNEEEVKTFFSEKLRSVQVAEKVESNDIEGAVKLGLKEMKSRIREVVKNHFTVVEKVKKDLTEKLIMDADLTAEEAAELAPIIQKEFDKLATEAKEKELRKMFPVSSKFPKAARKHLSEIDKIIKASNLGAMDDQTYTMLFANTFDLTNVTEETKAKMKDLITAVTEMPAGELRNRKQREFVDYLKTLEPKNYKSTSKNLVDWAVNLFYTNILSGLTTSGRNIKGLSMTVPSEVAIESAKLVAKNPSDFFKIQANCLKALGNGLANGKSVFADIMRDGFNNNEYDPDDRKGTKPLDKFMNREAKGIPENAAKIFLYLPVKIVRAMVATDALANSTVREFKTFVDAYNKVLNDGKPMKDQQFWDKVYKEYNPDSADLETAEAQAAREISELQEKGEKLSPKAYAKRVREIIQQRRSDEQNEYSMQFARKSTLNNNPEGLGGAVYEVVNFATTILPILKTLVPVIRIPTNAMNMWLDWSPWGFKRALFGRGASLSIIPDGTKLSYIKTNYRVIPTKEERITLLIKASISVAVYEALVQMALPGDDEKEKPLIRITADGYGDYKKNSSLEKGDWQEFSIGFLDRKTNKYEAWYSYKDSFLGVMLANIGYMSDGIKYKGMNKGEMLDLRLYGAMNSIFFVKEQNYMQALTEMASALGEKGKGKLDAAEKFFGNQTARIPRSLTIPNLYSQIYKNFKAISKTPDKKPTRMQDDFFKGTVDTYVNHVPFLEDLNTNEKFDQLGFPVIQELNIPFFPDGVAELMGHRAEKHPEWELVISKEAIVLFSDPREYNNKPISAENKVKIQKYVATELGKYLGKENEKLKMYGKDLFQKKINKKITSLTAKGKREVLMKGKKK